MEDKQEAQSILESKEEKKIPVFTVLKNGAILKNIFLLDNPPSSSSSSSNQETAEFEEILVVGRHPNCNITLEHPSISRFHLRIHSKPSSLSLSVTDLSSVHGTWISGKKIESGARVELKEGDRLQLGGSSRVYRLHWVPISRAYDMENPFVPENTQEEQHQDGSGFSSQNDQIQKEDDDMVQGLDSSFSGMSSLPRVRSLTPPAPPLLEQMSSPFPDNYEAANRNNLPGNIHEEGEISLLQPASYQPDKENSAPEALLVSEQSKTENVVDGTPERSPQRCSSIWSRRGKLFSVQIQTGRDRAMNENVDMETEVESLNRERAGINSVSKDLFASGNKDKEEEVFTPDKENSTPSSLFLGSMKKSCLSEMINGSDSKSVLSNMDENEENFTPDKENRTPNTRLLRSMKKMGSQHQVKHPKPFKSSSLKNVVEPMASRAEGLVSHKKEKLGSTTKSTWSDMDDNDEEMFTPDKENMTPGTHFMRAMKKIAMLEDVQHLEAFKFPLNSVVDSIFHHNGTPNLASRNLERSEVNTVKNRMDRVPFQSLLVNSPAKTSSISPHEDLKLSDSPIKYPETKEACPFSNNSVVEQNRTWTMVVDTGSLLNKESRKSLQLLQGLKGTHLIIPRTVVRELDCMKRRASLFRKTTEVSAALEWIEDCMVNAKSWIHVQSCAEETRSVAPTPPATAPLSLFNEENGMFPIGGSLPFSPHSGLMESASPTAEDHILEYALFFKRTNKNGQLVLLSNDLTMKIKAMAEGLNCETAEEFRESLVNPFSERFLWKDSSPRGRTWSCEDDFVLRETYYRGPPKKTGEAAKGLKLILLHNSHYRHICSAS
ncbi:PREDICTED: FHA domain-containing protein PS1-like [Nicotiana attenuata]|uniref:Fha domain-containing protein ps1 n=1 Tax=Nicotiana attenuata TaxID=49451 RepID=A0A314KUF9_NICAT|nr:PREDICTED: FHA domain-containing protein PS1-like [Nicotiana attenuata]OIT32973.1 fha domain-containing protein ps1 [Nicotiana attenuata]